MKLLIRILLPILILAGAAWGAWQFIQLKPEPHSFDVPPQVTKVEATRLKPQSFQVFLETRGTVRPRTTTDLIPEVSGRIVEISPHFREGGFFEKDEILLRIDRLNYETAKTIAESSAAQARAALREEEVRGQQALQNWKRLGKGGQPSEMVLRKPQLAEAKARLAAAEAEIVKAERDLERTEIRAPFAGRILEQNVDVGQYVSPGTVMGRAFATDVMEVRLPLTNQQLAFADLPESFRGEEENAQKKGPEVLVTSKVGRAESQWSGRVVRVDSALDESSRQLFVVAEVEDPYRRRTGQNGSNGPALKIGMFVDATVKGVELENVFVLPRGAVRVGGEVILIGPDNRIRRQTVEPIWSERDNVVVEATEDGGLKPGDVLCLTPLAYPANGALVLPTIDGVAPTVEFPEGRGPGMRGKSKKGKGNSKRGS